MDRLRNCSRCGRLFVRVHRSVCPSCLKKRDQDFARCRDYLRENPNTKMPELSKATGVPAQQIVQFIVEGRLILTPENPNLFYECERCKAPIRTGRWCVSCAQQFERDIQEVVRKDQKASSDHGDMRRNYRIFNRDN